MASLAAPVAAGAHYAHSKFSYGAMNDDQKIDPVSFVAYGPGVNADTTQFVVATSTGWGASTGGTGGQFGKDHEVWSEFDDNNADGTITSDRNHVRWNSSEPEGLGHDNYIYAAGTPHHEEFVTGGGCGFPGNHAVDSFVDGGENLKNALLDDKDFPWFYRFDGSTTQVRQCNGNLVGNDGLVIWMRLRPEPGLAASQRGASDGSARAVDNAEPIAVTQAIGRACETDDVPNFDHYFLGAEFSGLALTGRRRTCEPPPAVVRSEAGALVRERPVRINDVAYVYGDCALPATTEGGCVPPLQIISSPGCERPHSLYRRYTGPPELALGPEPHQDRELRGVKMSVFDLGTRLELYTSDATVTIAADTATRAAQAALAMVAAPSSRGGQRATGAALPPANPGVADEYLPQSKAPPAC